MELSIFLAKVLGLYLVIVPLAVLVNRKHLPRLVEEFSTNVGLNILASIFALVLGLLLVVSHNVWTADWRVLVTILGWLTLAKGVVRLLFLERMQKLSALSLKPWWAVVLVLLVLVGLYLSYVGFSTPMRTQ
jgi:hypothetical protein